MTLLAAAAGATASATTTTTTPGSFPYTFPTSAPYNVSQPIVTPTYEGSGQAVHPDVIDFHQETGQNWRGWRFWMVMTPYPNSIDSWEDPSILVSQDGWNWQVPAGLTNPLYPATTGYNSDPDIAYDPDADELVLIFRDPEYNLVMARSADGVTWPATTTPITWTPSGGSYYAPSILRTPDGVWHMWLVNNALSVAHWVSGSAEGPWGASVGYTNLSAPWHANVAYKSGVFYLLTHSIQNGKITAGRSTDGSTFVESSVAPLTNQATKWDSALYRPAMTFHENGTHMRVWYCGQSPTGQWRVGYTLVPLTAWPTA